MTIRSACALSVFIFLAAACFAEDVGNLPAHPIGKLDLLGINVYDAPEFSKSVRVSNAGEIELPMMKKALHAEGLLPTQLESVIAGELEAEQLLVRPSVTVTVAEYRSRSITVVGAVHKPITFQELGQVTLSEALTRAEGLMPDASQNLVILRAPDAEGHRRTESLSVASIPSANDTPVVLHAGDELRVPVAEKIFVVGNVRRPGAYRSDDSNTPTVMSMLGVSEGLLPYSNKIAYVYREAANGREEIPVQINDILQRKVPDMTLRAGDVFYVPDNRGRRLTMATLDRMINFGAGTASGMLIWRR